MCFICVSYASLRLGRIRKILEDIAVRMIKFIGARGGPPNHQCDKGFHGRSGMTVLYPHSRMNPQPNAEDDAVSSLVNAKLRRIANFRRLQFIS